MYDAVVIYDKDSRYHKFLSGKFEKFDNIKTVDWNSERAQDFLEAQFGWKPLNLIVLDNDKVYVGQNALDHLVERLGIPSVVSSLLKSRTAPFSTVASKAVDLRGEFDDISGEFPLKEGAKEYRNDFTSLTDIDIN